MTVAESRTRERGQPVAREARYPLGSGVYLLGGFPVQPSVAVLRQAECIRGKKIRRPVWWPQRRNGVVRKGQGEPDQSTGVICAANQQRVNEKTTGGKIVSSCTRCSDNFGRPNRALTFSISIFWRYDPKLMLPGRCNLAASTPGSSLVQPLCLRENVLRREPGAHG